MNSLSDYLSHWAEKQPEAPAVEFQGTSLSYGELDRQSSALARTLIQGGVVPGDRVGLWLHKSVEAVVAVYGILKTGAAYVPIDPSAPFKRAAHIVSHCEVAYVIAQDDRVEWLREHASCRIVSVGSDADEPMETATDGSVIDWAQALAPAAAPAAASAAAADVREPLVDVASPAFILHTSGSKGVPKGVMLSHGNARAFVEWTVEEFGLTSADRVSSHAPFHFDLSVLDLFGTCSAGGCVVLIPESQVGLGGALNKFVSERRITVWYSVPGALTRMLAAKNSALLAESSLRVVLFAGETFPITRLRELCSLVPAEAFYNLYGPTETNVCVFHRVRASDLAPHLRQPVPIGRPCPYAETFVVDKSGRALGNEPGASGELCVAGDSVMLGYWWDDELTATKTILVERAGAEPVRAYRTGDLVRVDDDLNYVFGGREDDMVKIRGHRVEIGEIEAVLAAADNVREAVCVAVGDGPDERTLEAYVVPGSDPFDVAQVRRHCLAEIPRYMVPDRFHVLDALPLNRNGKVDRRRLVES
ncbi:amino acid adenylation domain-containing protein [Actinomadura barringtoniae]|uniref:Amino acid adenylation domain-containing protein n=1 Tax=Actinomadura barringtoniae TaxID=1427535 RepID=A0A939P5J2_9ACTN|nr:amino acid adenylation domain-containing protein [Actinomadura barringtoniae]MBO2445661.1 amino acid adenylation domain-containing protein [Actinomadura barringtoniae]